MLNGYESVICSQNHQSSLVLTALRSFFTGKNTQVEAKSFIMENVQKENWSQEQITNRLKEIHTMMLGIDQRSIRSMRAILTKQDTESDRNELFVLEKSAQELRAEATMLALMQLNIQTSDNPRQ